MTPKISIVTAVVGVAAVLVVPAAWGSGEPYRDHGDAAQAKLALRSQPVEIVRDHGDATQARLAVQPSPQVIVRDHGDATQARLAVQPSPQVIVRDHGDATQARLALQSSPVTSSAGELPTVSGREIDWSQLGIGFGVGMFFVLGLIVAVRLTRSQRLAH